MCLHVRVNVSECVCGGEWVCASAPGAVPLLQQIVCN